MPVNEDRSWKRLQIWHQRDATPPTLTSCERKCSAQMRYRWLYKFPCVEPVSASLQPGTSHTSARRGEADTSTCLRLPALAFPCARGGAGCKGSAHVSNVAPRRCGRASWSAGLLCRVLLRAPLGTGLRAWLRESQSKSSATQVRVLRRREGEGKLYEIARQRILLTTSTAAAAAAR